MIPSFRYAAVRYPACPALVFYGANHHERHKPVSRRFERLANAPFGAFVAGRRRSRALKHSARRPAVHRGALHKAIDYALTKSAVTYSPASPADYRLSQAADYICTMELTALKYQDKAATTTDEEFFGSWSQFKKGILKEVRQNSR